MSWPLVKLGEVVTIKGGGTPSKKIEGYWNGNIPWASVKDLKSNKISKTVDTITELGVNNSATNIIPAGTILTATRMALGKFTINTVDMAINQDLKALFINDEAKVDRDFLIRFLESKSQFIDSEGKGATVKGITLDFLKSLEIPLPPLNEQKRIAAILDKADAIRRKRQQAIQLADDFLRSVFLDMFGDPVTNPKGWEVKSWKDVLSIVNGKNQKAVLSKNGAYPIMGSGGEMGRASDYLTPQNSVIIGRKGNINKPILVKENFWNVDTAFGLVPEPSMLSFNYLYWFCKFFDFERLNKAVTIPSLTKVDLLQISIPLPDISKQISFDKIVNKIELIISKNIHSSQSTNDIFNSLSQKAFAGEL
ncbi:restriction endonuclease subunit S [Pseudoalteromonas sp.]|uniref:restriction endonuclease subunit S n=1 Tax=Pseudoalteromonas sp. TaxID=53249 RepID=UPI001BD13417